MRKHHTSRRDWARHRRATRGKDWQVKARAFIAASGFIESTGRCEGITWTGLVWQGGVRQDEVRPGKD